MSKLTPYYQDEWATIYHGDCRDILPHLPKVDLVLTDPPYGLGARMSGGTWGAAGKYAELRKWDSAPDQSLVGLVLSRGANSIIWGGNYFHLPPSRCWLVWDKKNAVRTMADVELAWTSFDAPSLRFSWPVGLHRHGHPTEKPVELFLWALQISGNASSTIDPFMGSGTTLVAAKRLGRKSIGIELEQKYCDIAIERMKQDPPPFDKPDGPGCVERGAEQMGLQAVEVPPGDLVGRDDG